MDEDQADRVALLGVEAADGLPVLFDSGIRSGADVVKALALGATGPSAIASASRETWSSRDEVGTKMISSQPPASNAAAYDLTISALTAAPVAIWPAKSPSQP